MQIIKISRPEKYARGFEIYLAELCIKVRYNQILIDKKENRISSRSFLTWLDDKKTSKRLRLGLLSLYEKKHLEHFTNGVWQTRYLFEAMGFIRKQTQHPKFISQKKTRELFNASFNDPEWVEMATQLFGFKMLERLYMQDRLQTNIAKSFIQANFQYRELQNSYGKILGKCISDFKNFIKEGDFTLEQTQIAEAIFDQKIGKIRELQKDTVQVIFGNVLALLESHVNDADYQQYLTVKALAKQQLAPGNKPLSLV